ncbi:hypothetical protein IC582_016931 [Cucumis melo]
MSPCRHSCCSIFNLSHFFLVAEEIEEILLKESTSFRAFIDLEYLNRR